MTDHKTPREYLDAIFDQRASDDECARAYAYALLAWQADRAWRNAVSETLDAYGLGTSVSDGYADDPKLAIADLLAATHARAAAYVDARKAGDTPEGER
jgi:hypothetical protein